MKKFITPVLSLLLITLFTPHNTQAQTEVEKMVFLEISFGSGCSPCFLSFEDVRWMSEVFDETLACAHYAEAPVGMGDMKTWQQSPSWTFGLEFDLDYQSDCMMDRTYLPNNNSYGTSEAVYDIYEAYLEQINTDYLPVGVNIEHAYDAETRQVLATVTANFVEEVEADMGIYFILVQDSVVGPSTPEYTPYDQLADPDAAAGAGYTDIDTFDDTNDYVAINSFPHPRVVQYMGTGYFGNEGVIPFSVSNGDSFSETFSFQLPEYGSDFSEVPLYPEQMEIVAAVVKNGEFMNRQVLNAGKARLTEPSNITEISSSADVSLLGNPVQDELNFQINPTESLRGEISITNVMGQKVYSQDQVVAIAGRNNITTVDVSDLDAGVYFVGYKAGVQQYTQKFIVE